jgi:hypothetical protein
MITLEENLERKNKQYYHLLERNKSSQSWPVVPAKHRWQIPAGSVLELPLSPLGA